MTEQPFISQSHENPTESDETAITSNIPQVPQNRDYPDYEEEKRQDQERSTIKIIHLTQKHFENLLSENRRAGRFRRARRV